MKKQTVSYRGKPIRVAVDYPVRKKICQCCGKKGLTSLHHWSYEYPVKEIRKCPILVLQNTTELCFLCHDKANTLRKYYEIDKATIDRLDSLILTSTL